MFPSLPRMLIINEDNDHYFKKKWSLMTEKDLRAYIDSFADTRVTHFFMCPNGQRTSYRSAVHEAIWDDVNGEAPTNIWCRNCKILFDKGIDPYQVWIEQCRKRDISPWITMRMNDVHFVTTPDYFRNTTFWRERSDLWRVPEPTSEDWMIHAFDYSKQEAYDYHLALVRELFERYDFEGFETDWLRFPYHLTPGKGKEQAPVLTRFMREVRAIADQWEKKRGHEIKISARVSAAPDDALGMGTDAVLWALEGLVDIIVPSCFFSTADFDIPVEIWRERLGELGGEIPVVPGIDNGLEAYPGAGRVPNDLALYYGWAESARHRGAESFYLFNLVYYPTDQAPFRPIVDFGLDENVVAGKRRRHPITYRDAVPRGWSNGSQLPKTSEQARSFTVQTGKSPESGTADVIIALEERDGVREASFAVLLNGRQASAAEEIAEANLYGKKAARAIRYRFPVAALANGANEITVMPGEKDSTQKIIWVEIEITP